MSFVFIPLYNTESEAYRQMSDASITAKCLRALSGLFSPNLIDQSSCRILSTHAETGPILYDDWSSRLGEYRPCRASNHLAALVMLRCRTEYYFKVYRLLYKESNSRSSL